MPLEDVIHIAAAPEAVWAVTVDIERWPEWTPTVASVERLDEGPFAVGSRARIKQPRFPAAEWVVTELAPPARFVWESRSLGVRTVATHEIAPDGDGVRNLLRIEMSGPLAFLVRPLMRSTARRFLREENAGLKSRCETPR